jgi:hypothetical protein
MYDARFIVWSDYVSRLLFNFMSLITSCTILYFKFGYLKIMFLICVPVLFSNYFNLLVDESILYIINIPEI